MTFLRKLLRQRQAVAGLVLIALFLLLAIFAPYISPADYPTTIDEFYAFRGEGFRFVDNHARGGIPQPPQPGIWLGTDTNQYDIFHSLVWGTRSVLRFGIIVTVVTAVFGILIGAFSGYSGGWVQRLTLRVTDAFLSVPLVSSVWVVTLVVFRWGAGQLEWLFTILDNLQLTGTMLTFMLFLWMPYARVMNAGVLVLKEASFVQAAVALGANRWRVVINHLIPNALAPVIVLMARDVGATVTFAAALEIIRIGTASEWGTLLADNRQWVIGIQGNIFTYWWVYLPLTLGFILYGIAWSLVGDGLNKVLNPKQG